MENIEKSIEAFNAMANVPQTIDFVVKDDFVKNLPAIISNIEDVKLWAKAQTEIDKNLILQSDEDFEYATKRCAEFNKISKKIDSDRIYYKKQYNQPFEIFEKEVKAVQEILQEARNNLWSQIKRAEQEKKDKAEQQYRHYYESTATEKGVINYRSWEQIFNEKWLNKSAKADTVLEEINAIITNIENDVVAIKSLHSEFEPSLFVKYSEGANLTEIITYNNRLKAEKQALESQKATIKADCQPQQEKPQEQPQNKPSNEEKELFVIDFRIWVDDEQLKALKEFLISNKIKYGKVPTE